MRKAQCMAYNVSQQGCNRPSFDQGSPAKHIPVTRLISANETKDSAPVRGPSLLLQRPLVSVWHYERVLLAISNS